MRYLGIILFAVVIALIMKFLLNFTETKVPDNCYVLEAYFSDTGRVNEGAPITMAGLDIGQIASIELDHEKRGVNMELAIKNGINIPDDSNLKIAEKGMLGEMYLSFDFGKSKTFYQPHAKLVGKPPLTLTDFMSGASGTVEDVGTGIAELTKSINKVIGDQQVQKDLKASFKELPDVISSLKMTIDQNRNHIQELLKTFTQLGQNTNHLVVDIKDEVGKFKEEKAVESLSNILKQLDTASGELNKTLVNVNGTLKGADGLGEDVKKTVEQVYLLTSKLNKSEGTGGKVINDAKLYDNLNSLVLKTKQLIELLEENPSSIIFGKKKKRDLTKHAQNMNKKLNLRSLDRNLKLKKLDDKPEINES